VIISSPDLTAPRSVLADWIEITALLRERAAGAGDLDSLYRLNSDDDRRRRHLDDGVAEEEIVELAREELSSRVGEEIEFRARALGELYPFTVVSNPFRVTVRREANSTAHSAYLFMLLMSANHYGFLPANREIRASIDFGRRLFHICASIGVAGLLRRGKTYWFGFPRPDKSNFANALADLSTKIGYAKAFAPAPAGLPVAAKDDQVDVIGWRAYGDRRIGTMVVVCQAATGDDWDSKSVQHHLQAFLDWFERVPYRQAMGSLAVPFPGHHEVDEPVGDTFETALSNALSRLNSRHGVVLDRLRITESIPALVGEGNGWEDVAGHAEVRTLQEWIDRITPQLHAAA
jgi:hypothetical protein